MGRLTDAVEKDDILDVNELLNKAPRLRVGLLSEINFSGLTALHIAAKDGKIKILEALLNAGADVNLHSSSTSLYDGYTALGMAVFFRQCVMTNLCK